MNSGKIGAVRALCENAPSVCGPPWMRVSALRNIEMYGRGKWDAKSKGPCGHQDIRGDVRALF